MSSLINRKALRQNKPQRRGSFQGDLLQGVLFVFLLFMIVVSLLIMGVTQLWAADGSTGSVNAGREARGLVRSAARVEVQTDLIAAVAKAPFVEGQRFAKGDTLLTFACGRYWAQIKAAKASRRAAYVDLKAKKQLVRYQAAGQAEVQQAQAEVARTAAEVEALAARAIDCKIKAPFAGRVVALHTRVHEMPKANEPLITIIDDNRLELELVVPSRWLVWLQPGAAFDFLVDETGLTHGARVDRIGAEVDPVSQTIKIIGTFPELPSAVLAGMSGTAVFESVAN